MNTGAYPPGAWELVQGRRGLVEALAKIEEGSERDVLLDMIAQAVSLGLD